MTDTLRLDIDARGVARLTLNRPEVRNAFDDRLITALLDAVQKLRADESVRAIVLTGEGKAFSAGADLKWMRRAAEFSEQENRDDARRLSNLMRLISTAPQPTIARVNGAAFGGGVGLVACCDIAVASEEAIFALSEVRLGLIPAVISPFVVEAMGARQARRYFLTGERFDAETARRIGLVHMVAMGAQLEATFDGMVKHLLSCGPNAQHEAKELIRAVAGVAITDSVMEETAGRIARLRASTEGKEGMTAFLEKRKPNWVKGA